MSLTSKQKKALKLLGDRSRRFRRMTKKHQRATIAKDVIEQIRMNKIVPGDSHWASVPEWTAGRPAGSDLRTEIVKAKQCTACVLGAAFICGYEGS